MSGGRLVTYPDRDTQARELAATVGDELRAALEGKANATLAVAGGKTPAKFFELLSRQKLDWARVVVLPTDERVVAENDERSNMGLIRRTLLKNEAAAARAFPLVGADGSVSFDATEADLRLHLPLDVCVLGMGEDMHTASLFPGAKRLAEGLDLKNGRVLIEIEAPNAAEPRISLTAAVLRWAAHVHLLIAGAGKRAALERARSGRDWAEAPVRSILTGSVDTNIHYSD